MKRDKPLFVFMDESGRKESDRYFVCGFLEVNDNEKFCAALRRVFDQIMNLSIRNRSARVDKLLGDNDLEGLYHLARTYNEFELKHYHISRKNQTLCSDLIKALFAKTEFRFTAIVADRMDKNYERDPKGQFPLYLKAFKLYASYCVSNPNYIFVPDSFDPSFEWNMKTGKLPVSILPLDSKAGEKPNNKEIVRQPVLDTLETLLGRKIDGKFTVSKPHYFNVWPIDWSKTKRPGHGQETQPRS